jgi:hypothetical protein
MTVITSGLRRMWRAVWMLVANFPRRELALWPRGSDVFWPFGPAGQTCSGPLGPRVRRVLALWARGSDVFWPFGPAAPIYWPSGSQGQDGARTGRPAGQLATDIPSGKQRRAEWSGGTGPWVFKLRVPGVPWSRARSVSRFGFGSGGSWGAVDGCDRGSSGRLAPDGREVCRLCPGLLVLRTGCFHDRGS